MSDPEYRPIPRAPRDERPRLRSIGDWIGNFLVLNAVVGIFGFLATPNFTAGANSSAHLDPGTGRPVLMELQGCEILPPSPDEEKGGR